MKKIILAVYMMVGIVAFGEIVWVKTDKITEDSAKIIFETDKNEIGYINGLKIDEVPKKSHYFYLDNLVPNSLNKVLIKADEDIKTIEIKTTIKNIDYSKTPDFLNNAIFYEIFVRAFADSNNDGIGDLNGITENLDYIKSLGVNGIWLMPINSSPSYHGYDVTDYYSINKEYGDLDDFKNLIKEAHKKGIKILMDLVLNHTSSKHPYFKLARKSKKAPYRDWYVWNDKPKSSEWYKNNDGEFYYSAFWSEMPDLNYHNPLVVSEAKNISDYWLNMGVDGFRLDAAKHIDDTDSKFTHEFWYSWRKSIKNTNKNAIIVAENWTNSNEIAPYYKEFDMNFNFDLSKMMIDTISRKKDMGLVDFINGIYKEYKMQNPNFVDAPFLTNHDMKRIMNHFIIKKYRDLQMKQISTMLFTMGGVPFIYYGEEIGQRGNKPDEHIREPFDWYKNMTGQYMAKWITPKDIKADDGVSVEEEKDIKSSLLNHYKKMIKLRNKYKVLRNYNISSINLKERKIYGYIKSDNKEKIIILFNFGRKNAEIKLEDLFKENECYDLYNNKKLIKKVEIPKYGFAILKKE
ncbi:alpha-amylase family glycosyl hydrolase [Haliovirga abyssi]|uniref:Alpha-amylase n=1 Tax=Haliovirga abyssi TaxID=2996794 RepID=A0AAU9DBJ8_9FUSO|nr:alpha-amylase family glycosyl hydrolase [Haliovirga abyssi]BDU49622.1 alpha-amylase [Haliovirga abyssi]